MEQTSGKDEPHYEQHAEYITYGRYNQVSALRPALPDLPETIRPATSFEDKYPEYAKYFQRIRNTQSPGTMNTHQAQQREPSASNNSAHQEMNSEKKPFSKSPKNGRKVSNKNRNVLRFSNNLNGKNYYQSTLLQIPETFHSNIQSSRSLRNNGTSQSGSGYFTYSHNSTAKRQYLRLSATPPATPIAGSTADRTTQDLRQIESILNVASFSKNSETADTILQGNSLDIVAGSVNGIEVLWDRSDNKLMVKDRVGLEENISVEGGVPFVFVQYMTDEGVKTQKMIVDDHVRR